MYFLYKNLLVDIICSSNRHCLSAQAVHTAPNSGPLRGVLFCLQNLNSVVEIPWLCFPSSFQPTIECWLFFYIHFFTHPWTVLTISQYQCLSGERYKTCHYKTCHYNTIPLMECEFCQDSFCALIIIMWLYHYLLYLSN